MVLSDDSYLRTVSKDRFPSTIELTKLSMDINFTNGSLNSIVSGNLFSLEIYFLSWFS